MEGKDWRIPPNKFGVFVGRVGDVREKLVKRSNTVVDQRGPLSKVRSLLKGERKSPTKTSGVEIKSERKR